MNIELLGIGVTLFVAIIATWRDISNNVDSFHDKLDTGLHDLRDESSKIGERVAYIEGVLAERDRHAPTTPEAKQDSDSV